MVYGSFLAETDSRKPVLRALRILIDQKNEANRKNNTPAKVVQS